MRTLAQKTCLILGGARSGKSAHAEKLAREADGNLHYVATAQALDAEMTARIAHHQAARGHGWRTHEVPVELVACLEGLVRQERPVVLVDCLTLWVTNLMLGDRDVGEAGDRLAAFIADCPYPLFLVANEVGLGIVPDNALARKFRDEAGLLNQKVAAAADTVIFMAAGLPMTMKPTS
ncbi:bifunctional adenosylcobinamide kinase/adenosylcobinamide-phosphate guanylyltransferase [Martelella radicis]|uniref:Bifunctional adenosylcobalamin biosynthesis protein n=1 Tax=Martelella radicis TaxID=1397476 RepID=A0A7W6KI91_9HYPH|nr:bifunctional adenosylcobinamide kinase/adenosylcobinamide-phosphate guanylyltransferase [Martelella radicis]MBB4121786.1 adenosylcobinamide kinase/adenosylcobinamide-phosphate guanylyltransferase [Martelella radicis]